MKKKTLALALAMLLILLAACGGSALSADTPKDMDMIASEEWATAPEYEGSVGGVTGESVSQPAPQSMTQDKIIYSADAEIETKEYDKSIDDVYNMISDFDGFLQSSSLSGTEYNRSGARNALFTVRIPSERFNELTGSLSSLGNVAYCRTNAENVTTEYFDVQSRLESYRIQEERLLTMLESAETLEDMLTIEGYLSDIRYNIEYYTTYMTSLDNEISYSTITLRINEVIEYSPDLPLTKTFGQELSEALSGGITALVELVQGLILIVAYSWYLFLIVGIIIFLVIRRSRKQRAARDAMFRQSYGANPESDNTDN